MALTKGTNSYVTVSEADAYFEDRLDAAAWTEAPESQKSQSLVTATSLLDDSKWTGVAVRVSQPLAFPRQGSYFDPKLGTRVLLGNDTPSRVVQATFELAYHLLNNDGLLDNTGGVKDLTVGDLKLTGVRAASVFPGVVLNLIRPLLINGGSAIWWRAN
jgi:hypothetical protein